MSKKIEKADKSKKSVSKKYKIKAVKSDPGKAIKSAKKSALKKKKPSNPLSGLKKDIEGLRDAGAYFHSRGWSVGTSSNYSVKIKHDPLTLLVTASGMDKGALKKDDFVVVNAGGMPTTSGQPKSSAETLLHVVAAENKNVGSVLHTHSVWGTILSEYYFDQGGFEIDGYEMLKGLAGNKTHEMSEWVPIFDNTQDMDELASQVRKAMKSKKKPLEHGYLIRRHGLYTWGPTLADARRQIEIYEFLFECVGRQLMLEKGLEL